MIDLRKSLSANCRYTPGVIYITAPSASYSYRVKEVLEFYEGGCEVAPEVKVTVQENAEALTLTARRLNVRNRFAGAVQRMSIPLPVTDRGLNRAVKVFAHEWYDLQSPIFGDLDVSPSGTPKSEAPDPLCSLVIFYVLKFKRMPPMQVLALIQGKPLQTGELSDIEIDNDTRIRLPQLLDKPLGLNPLQRTVYILFLRHPEGIVLRMISDYTRELEEIYQMVKGSADSERSREAITNLCDPLYGTLHQQLSRIKQKILKSLPNKKLADAYAIQGKHSAPYSIAAIAGGDVEFHSPAWLTAIPVTH